MYAIVAIEAAKATKNFSIQGGLGKRAANFKLSASVWPATAVLSAVDLDMNSRNIYI